MTLEDYQIFVDGLVSGQSKVDFTSKLLTSALGLAGETGECLDFVCKEFNKEKFVEEMSDLMWYFTLACNTLEKPLRDVLKDFATKVEFSNSPPDSFKNLLIFSSIDSARAAGKFADVVKKHLFHGKDLNKDLLFMALNDLIDAVYRMCMTVGVSVQGVIDVNVNKLKDRYKSGKFTFEEFMQKERNNETLCGH